MIGKAKERERRKLGETLEQEESKGRLLKIVKQMVKKMLLSVEGVFQGWEWKGCSR